MDGLRAAKRAWHKRGDALLCQQLPGGAAAAAVRKWQRRQRSLAAKVAEAQKGAARACKCCTACAAADGQPYKSTKRCSARFATAAKMAMGKNTARYLPSKRRLALTGLRPLILGVLA
ncbi:hypothetical protein NPIL_657951 [Nephila pilipes]|uniref:Uncharacterized protein n=1 Tax=Nephila pilipes TaxID=299642 RepID=A0A8X6PCG0_NEPPI|nr:hypothetical protein NPIL_657951 [Nephila pilipes]